MNKILNYLFSTSSCNEGINIIIFRTITINNDDIIIDKIIEDIINSNIDSNKIDVNNKYCTEILSFDYATLHYYIESETNNFIKFNDDDDDILEHKLNKIIKRNFYKKEKVKEIDNIWNNNNIKNIFNINYIIIYEEYYDNSYHNIITNNISVNTYIELEILFKKEINKLKKQIPNNIGYLFIFYIINNEENIKWRRYDENNLF
jgi:hypothetical protein